MRKPSEENKLEEIRKKIDEIDAVIADLLLKRVQYAKQAKKEKARMNKPVRDRQREKEVIEKWCERARRRGNGEEWNLSEEMMKKIATLVIEYTLKKEIEDGNE
jgi:chorismate mutase